MQKKMFDWKKRRVAHRIEEKDEQPGLRKDRLEPTGDGVSRRATTGMYLLHIAHDADTVERAD